MVRQARNAIEVWLLIALAGVAGMQLRFGPAPASVNNMIDLHVQTLLAWTMLAGALVALVGVALRDVLLAFWFELAGMAGLIAALLTYVIIYAQHVLDVQTTLAAWLTAGLLAGVVTRSIQIAVALKQIYQR